MYYFLMLSSELSWTAPSHPSRKEDPIEGNLLNRAPAAAGRRELHSYRKKNCSCKQGNGKVGATRFVWSNGTNTNTIISSSASSHKHSVQLPDWRKYHTSGIVHVPTHPSKTRADNCTHSVRSPLTFCSKTVSKTCR